MATPEEMQASMIANLVAHLARNRDAAGGSGPGGSAGVPEEYAGKTALRPIYERLAAAVREFGDDIEFAPKKLEPAGRLESSGGWNAPRPLDGRRR